MKEQIEHKITQAIKELQSRGTWPDFEVPPVSVERPKELAHGDWTSNVAFLLAKKVGKPPHEIAQSIGDVLQKQKSDDVQQVESIGGYINITVPRQYLIGNLGSVVNNGDAYGRNETLAGQTVMVEYTQPNPFKPFHIGHLMSNTIGESLACLIAACGAHVIRANYQGDVGPHVAKALWGIQEQGGDIKNIDDIAQAYVYAHTQYEKEESVKEQIDTLNKKIYEGTDQDLMDLYNTGRSVTLEHFEELYKILGTTFDEYFFESETWERGKEVVGEHIGDIFEKSKGAIIFAGEKYGLHTRVFITAQGLPTYEAKDIGLALLKKQKAPADLYIIDTAIEQEQYFKVVKKAIELVDPSFVGKIEHIAHGMMQLADGKMSSRTGNVVTGESLIVDARALARKKVSERVDIDLSEEIVDMIAVAGIKFAILRGHHSKNTIYDPDTALSFDGDSGPYIQYTHARCNSVVSIAQGGESDQEADIKFAATDRDGDKESLIIERMIDQYTETIARAAQERAPHYIAQYALHLAHEFNTYYANHKIIDEDNPSVSAYRVLLTRAVGQVLKNSLLVLGIKAPQRM